MTLNYKASNIAKAEKEHGKNFFTVISSLDKEAPSMTDVLFVLEAGGVTQDEAGKMVDDKGINDSTKEAVERLISAGFLGSGKEVEEAKRLAEKLINEDSQSTGKTTKASPSQ